jgi:hypothetical protein
MIVRGLQTSVSKNLAPSLAAFSWRHEQHASMLSVFRLVTSTIARGLQQKPRPSLAAGLSCSWPAK